MRAAAAAEAADAEEDALTAEALLDVLLAMTTADN
jgi:hypothetical protein